MRDARIPVWTSQTISADGTYYGPTISLLADYAGNNHIYGTSDYGLPVELIGKNVVTGTGDGFTLSFSWQASDDGTTWDEDKEFGEFRMDTDGLFIDDAGASIPAAVGLTRVKVNGRIETTRAYARIKCVAAGITNGESIDVSGFMSDGANPRNDRKFR